MRRLYHINNIRRVSHVIPAPKVLGVPFYGDIITVGSGKMYATLAAATAAANGAHEALFLVYPGTYTNDSPGYWGRNFYVLGMCGLNLDSVYFNYTDATAAIYLYSPNVIIENFSIYRASYEWRSGIWVTAGPKNILVNKIRLNGAGSTYPFNSDSKSNAPKCIINQSTIYGGYSSFHYITLSNFIINRSYIGGTGFTYDCVGSPAYADYTTTWGDGTRGYWYSAPLAIDLDPRWDIVP